MLESIRTNLKGTLVVVVIIIFIVPMVISGVGTTFLGGAGAAGGAADVNGEIVSAMSLDRAMRNERNRLLQMGGIDASSPLLEDANLKKSALDRLISRSVLITNASANGMAISEQQYAKSLLETEAFLTDGQFDQQKFRTLLAQSGYTTSDYRKEFSGDLLLSQQVNGVQSSAFISDFEFSQIARLTHQKRDFFSIVIPKTEVSESVTVSEEEILEYYDANQALFSVPEKVQLEYLELNLEDLADAISVEESDIRAQYEAEIANFDSEASYTVAHILIEDSDQENISVISEALANGQDFSELAKEYSDDFASKDIGGDLGVFTKGMFPEEFENALYALEEGQVSGPTETEFGTHFIKAVSKETVEVPSYESLKERIQRDIALVSAKEEFSIALDQLGELTFSSDGLADAAEQMNLTISTTGFFDRSKGEANAITSFAKVRSAAFSDDVKLSGHNSNIVELSPERSVVVRVANTQESFVSPLAEVRSTVEQNIKNEKVEAELASKAAELEEMILAGL